MREVLLDGAKAGTFLQVVYECSLADREERDDLAQELAALHNEKLVDVVEAFRFLKNDKNSRLDFFLTRHVFENALPLLNAPVAPVMHCVIALCREAGQDMAAGIIFNNYIEFCAKDASRPLEALRLIEAEPDALLDLLAATVAAGSRFDNMYYMAELLRLIHLANIEFRRNAVFALARIHWPEGASVPVSAITALEEVVAVETDDRIIGNAVKTAFALFKQDNVHMRRVVELISAALAKGGNFTLHAASELLWLNTNELPSELLHLLIKYLKRVKPENRGTIDNIDYGIAHLLKSDDPEEGLRFFEELLIAHDEQLEIEILDSAASAVRESAPLMRKVVTRWLLRGERSLCEAAHEIVGKHYVDDLRLEIDASELNPADHIHIVFLARKAIGYFFMKPVTAASVVISLMRYAQDAETLDALGELLFDPLLLNYTGGVHDYVKEQAGQECGKVKETIEKSLLSIERYLESLRAVPELPSLFVSQSQRESYHRYWSESMSESMKAAEKNSIFFNLFARSTLLYGNKSINYIYSGSAEPPRRMEMPLTCHGVTMEFPRMDNIDPYGLNYMLRVFQVERLSR